MAEGLRSNGSLITLDLSSNAISSDGSVALAEALHSEKCVLAELQLAHNRIGKQRAAAGCQDALAVQLGDSMQVPLQLVCWLLRRDWRVPQHDTRSPWFAGWHAAQ